MGQISGLLVASFGLSSGLFTLIYALAFSPSDNVAGFILFIAITVGVVATLGVIVMRAVCAQPEVGRPTCN